MMTERPYCALLDIFDDLEMDGVRLPDKPVRFIAAASQLLDKRGYFVPVAETRRYDGSGTKTLWIDPLLEVTSITVDGAALATDDYFLYPRNRHWRNGPYSSIELASGARWTGLADSVVIAGQWGLYDQMAVSGATANQADANTATTLQVDDASALSPGVIVLLEDEQEVIEGYAAPLDINCTLAAALDNAAPDFNVSDGDLLNVGEIVRIDTEQMRVLDIDEDTLLVVRGWNGTTRDAHDVNTSVDVYREFNVTRAVNGTASAAHNTVDVLRVLPPPDVRYLCEQIAALMLKKSQSGFAGKVGNIELGEVFYNQEFPDDPIKKVMVNYRIVTV